LAPAEQIEMAIVVSGARGDLGQTAAAVQHLRDLARAGSPRAPWAARLRYAYAAALEADGQAEEARDWYARAAEVDIDEQTDVREVLGLDEEPELVDLLGGDDDDVEVTADRDPGRPDAAAAGEPADTRLRRDDDA
jgi:TPR repeat protein